MNDRTHYFRVVTLKDLWNLFLRRAIIILLAAAVTFTGYMLIDRISFAPMYRSTATLYLLRENENISVSSGEASNEFALALKMVNDCDYLLKSRTVVEQVIWDLGLDQTYDTLKGRISTSNPTNTRILEVSVTGRTPQEAKDIVDRLCEVGQAKITEAMGFQQVNLYEYGTLPTRPCNRTNQSTFLLAAVVAAAAVYAFFLLAYLMDDRVRTDEDIEHGLGLSILAEIPNLGGINRNLYGYYRRYSYGYGYRKSGYGYGQKRGTAANKEKRS